MQNVDGPFAQTLIIKFYEIVISRKNTLGFVAEIVWLCKLFIA